MQVKEEMKARKYIRNFFIQYPDTFDFDDGQKGSSSIMRHKMDTYKANGKRTPTSNKEKWRKQFINEMRKKELSELSNCSCTSPVVLVMRSSHGE